MKQGVNIESLLATRTGRSLGATRMGGESTPRREWSLSTLGRGKSITDKDKSDFCTQLSVMLTAGVSLQRALEVLTLQTKSIPMKGVLGRVRRQIDQGKSLSEALKSEQGKFDSLFVMSAHVGEESGRLSEVLSHLAIHLEKVANLKRKFRQALTYPVFVLSVAAGAVLFLLLFIVPTFAELFKSFQIEIPLTTRIVLSISNLLSSYGLLMLGGLIVTIYLIRGSLRLERIRRMGESLVMGVPFFGEILLYNHLARFCRTIGTLLQSRVVLLEALEIARKLAGHERLERDIASMIAQIRGGKAMSEPVLRSTIFPPMVAQMIAVGEETSELDRMLLQVAGYYERELDHRVDTLSAMIEPFLILALSIIVAGILAAMYLPMFDLVNVVSGS
jgi:type IV pilus assembly protein PilC